MENIISSIITAALTATVTFWGFWRQARANLENEYLRKFNEKKWDIYTDFIITFRKKLDIIVNKPLKKNQIEEDFLNLATQLLLVASDDVVRAFRKWRTLSDVNGLTDPATFHAFFELISEMRKDLGSEVRNLSLEDMLGSLIPNYRRSL